MENNGKIFFSIIIPTLNEEGHIPLLLDDLKNQTFRDFEIIVVDGKSKDGTVEVAKKNGAKVLIGAKRNVSYQRNLGSEVSKAPWLVFMDADNRISKTFLKRIKSYLEKNKVDILSTWLSPDSESDKDKVIATAINIFMEINKNSKKPYVMESMLIIKNSAFKLLGGFNPKIPWSEGQDLLQRARKLNLKFSFIRNPKYTYSFRRLKKMGTLNVLWETSQMELIKMLKGGELTKKDTAILYPMKGGKYYKSGGKPSMTMRTFISLLFGEKAASQKSLKSFQKSINSGKRFFR